MIKINRGTFSNVAIQEQLSLSANKVLEFVCTVIRTVEFYTRSILLIGVIDLFKLRNQEGNKSVNHAEEQKCHLNPDPKLNS